MARTGTDENKQANTQANQWQTTAMNSAQGDLSKYRTNEDTLAKGGEVGADPFLNPTYLGNVNRLNADVLNANEQSGKTQLQNLNRRTGGLNTGATQSAIAGLRMNTARLGTQLNSQRASEDYGKNLQWQQYLAAMPLASSGQEAGLFSGATGQRTNALGNLTSIGNASYGPWNSLIQGASGALAGAVMPGGAISNMNKPQT